MQTKELKKVKCIIRKCSSVFKTLPNDKTKACSNFCREEYSRMKGGKEYRRLERYKGLNGKICRYTENLELDY